MDWSRQFYGRQQQWLQVYGGPITDHHRRLAAQVEAVVGVAQTAVLELGAGGGQFATALAQRGYDVTAVDFTPANAEHIRSLALQAAPGTVTVLAVDFYEVSLPLAHYAAICYWDGFGVGSDGDQVRLLQRMARWLRPDGVILMDVYTPWYWAAQHGREMDLGSVKRRYTFDARQCRMLDTWWLPGDPDSAVTQSLRCYSPADLQLLLDAAGLRIQNVTPGGGFDPVSGQYSDSLPLAAAMTYQVQLVKTDVYSGIAGDG